MWLRRTKSTAPCHVTSPTFVRSSFKDIESLFAEENNNNQNDNNNITTSSTSNNNNNNKNSPKSQIGNVFHRVRRAQSLFWAFTNPPQIEQNVPHRKNVPNHQENTPNRKDVPNEENVEGLIHNSKSLHCGGNDHGGVLSEGNGEGLMQSSKLLVKDDGGVSNEENVEESIGALKSLHCHDKGDGGGVVGGGGSGGCKECVVEEAIGIGEVVDANVLGNDDGGVVRIELPGTETRVVIFFTSLRVIRSTFLDCKYVRSILHSFRVAIDERDLFMDGRFMAELQRIMCIDEKTNLTLPRVFIGGRYICGAEEIRQLHEAGELKKYLEGMAPAPAGTCEVCGGHGFILCIECNGSHKCYADKGGFKTCTGCNENGLVRCPSCSSAPL